MNYFAPYDWKTMMNRFPVQNYSVSDYHKILSPEMPDFLEKYLTLPIMERLKGIGLLCGTDWTSLYNNRMSYSRYDHSLGVALITWHFTHSKEQTLAGLFHDVSTPLFSHVADFRKGDALTQSATEEPNAQIIRNDKKLAEYLAMDGIDVEKVTDYHLYPVADNEIPQLSSDRLEYMYPSGMALDGSWTMEEIAFTYNDLFVGKNEDGIDELTFRTVEAAELYCEKFCMIGHILQLNENKLTLQLLAETVNRAIQIGILREEDCLSLSEKAAIALFDEALEQKRDSEFSKLYRTFRNMKVLEHTDSALNPDDYFSISLKVKQRYINPLVKLENGTSKRIYEVSSKAKKIIDDFLSYSDTLYGCVRYLK